MAEEKKQAGRPKERPEGEVSLKNRLPQNLYRVLKGVSGLRGMSMNDAVTEAVELWAKQYPALVSAVDSIQSEPSTPKKEAAKSAGSVTKTDPIKKAKPREAAKRK